MDSGKDPDSVRDGNHIVIELDTIRDLLVAPDFDPFQRRRRSTWGNPRWNGLLNASSPVGRCTPGDCG
ncbi:MAG: hypothetical protein GKC05_03800 [Methanomicrobiales archaeon]|nr:hypothetical protein [Methanomicrobiales archaeon]NYT21461.1 hypothetical protein [Methanomicrobiales archaeon]